MSDKPKTPDQADKSSPAQPDTSRRTFLKVTGASVIGATAVPAVIAGASGHHGPEEGKKQWAMVVDIQRCLREGDCTKCFDACHRVHNVPDISKRVPPEMLPKREIKWIWKEHYEGAFPEQQHEYIRQHLRGKRVPVLCNHCAEPPCVRVCPTQATWKRESDGIVMMDMHRCIGCRYCVVGCPYGSRSFNWMAPWPRIEHPDGSVTFDPKVGEPPNMKYPTRMKGVVEKCNFCSERLAESERTGGPFVPACVEACTAGALIFGDVGDPHSRVRKLLEARHTIRRKPGLGTRPQVYYIV
jgi:molybdopterin-containing oxidoreductase family iron-sulfur binding subunit